MLMMISHTVEISVAGGVDEIVCDPNPEPRACPYIRVLLLVLALGDS